MHLENTELKVAVGSCLQSPELKVAVGRRILLKKLLPILFCLFILASCAPSVQVSGTPGATPSPQPASRVWKLLAESAYCKVYEISSFNEEIADYVFNSYRCEVYSTAGEMVFSESMDWPTARPAVQEKEGITERSAANRLGLRYYSYYRVADGQFSGQYLNAAGFGYGLVAYPKYDEHFHLENILAVEELFGTGRYEVKIDFADLGADEAPLIAAEFLSEKELRITYYNAQNQRAEKSIPFALKG